MKIRATEERDLPAVMEILHQAQALSLIHI